jgi:hypothetical protein
MLLILTSFLLWMTWSPREILVQRYASQEAYDQALSAHESSVADAVMKVPTGDILD